MLPSFGTDRMVIHAFLNNNRGIIISLFLDNPARNSRHFDLIGKRNTNAANNWTSEFGSRLIIIIIISSVNRISIMITGIG